MGSHTADWATKSTQVLRKFELATYQFECNVLA